MEFHDAVPVDFLAWAALVISAALLFPRTFDPQIWGGLKDRCGLTFPRSSPGAEDILI